MFTQEQEDASPAVLRIAVGSSNPAKIRAVEQALQRAVRRHHDGASDTTTDNTTRRTVQLEIQGFSVPSGVPDQPFGDDETKQGAQHRAQGAYQEYRRSNHGDNKAPHLAIGLEGGLEWLPAGSDDTSDADAAAADGSGNNSEHPQDLFCMAWMAVFGKRDAVTVDCLASADTASYSGDRKPVFGLAKTALFPIPNAVADLVKQGVELGDADDQVFQRVKSKHGSGVVGILTDNLIDRSAYYEHAITLALLPWIRPDLYPDGN